MTKKIDTKELAEMVKCKAHTPLRSLCMKGNYLGLVPTKLPNGRLLWDLEAVEKLLNGSLPA